MLRTIASLSLCLAALLDGCAPGVTVPRPNASPSRPIPPVEASTMQVPVTIDLASILAQVESTVPREFKASNDWTVVDKNALGDLGLRFEAVRDPLKIVLRGQRIVATARVRYWVEVAQRVTKPIVGGSIWQKLGSCGRGEPLREVEVGLESDVSFDANWTLLSKSRVSTPTFANQCRMTFLKVNVTDRVAGAFRQALDRAATTVDQQIARQGKLRPVAERIWNQLLSPVVLDSGFSLSINPTGAGIISINGSGKTLTATLGITAQPTVVHGATAPRTTQLSPLTTTKLPDGLHVSVDGELSFAELNRQLATKLAGTQQKVDGRDITVLEASAYGSGDQIVVQLKLAGDMNGTIYFVGTPSYDPKSAVLSIDDLDYSLETREALLKVADWLYHQGFRQSIAKKARWGLEHGISQVRARIEKALNRDLTPGVRMTATVSAVRPVGVFVTPESLRARVVIDGALRLEVR
ncbi:MAG: DUF4403 family protein [bacterium]|nr:DUF4403 family protein [Candidatus Kapabacteria bacterium]